MDSNAQESSDLKAEFPKPDNDAATTKYRRRSPTGGSSSSSYGSPRRDRSLSPAASRKDIAKVADDKRRKDDGWDLDSDNRRHQSTHSGESYKPSDWHSSRGYKRHDDYGRRDRHVDDYDRGYSKSSYRSGWDSRDNNNFDCSRRDKENHSRDYLNGVGKYSQAKSESSGDRGRERDSYDRAESGRRHANIEERDRYKDRDRHRGDKGGRYVKSDQRDFEDHNSDLSPSYEDTKSQRNESHRRDPYGNRLKESSRRDPMEQDGDKHVNEEKREYDGQDRYKEQNERESEIQADGTKAFSSKDKDSAAKKQKFSSLESAATATDEQSYVKDSDIDAAKIAAMRAAELVNKNLVGTGYLSTDQKKKLLWGNKKNTASEESAHRWDTTTFGDRERQEKFNKLMGVKADTNVEHKPDNRNIEKQQEQLQMELERQYTAGLRRRDGRTVGLGL